MIDILLHHNWLFLTLTAVLGLIVGSFLNVVIYRLPIMLTRAWQQSIENTTISSTSDSNAKVFNLCFPHSHCPSCQHQLTIKDNIPLLSYIFLRGRCRHCQHKISWRYPMVELLTAITSVIVAYRFGVSFTTIAGFIFTWFLICMTIIDLQTQLLPDILTMPFLWLGLLLSLFAVFTNSQQAIIGAITGYLVLWLVNYLYHLIRKTPGMGHGDFKLTAGIGAWLGWQALPFVIFIASLIGSCIGISLILFKNYNRQTAIPFGPFLALAGWIVLLWQPNLSLIF